MFENVFVAVSSIALASGFRATNTYTLDLTTRECDLVRTRPGAGDTRRLGFYHVPLFFNIVER